ncbi:MAG TPA: helix-hairpin-helix domain-containing protein [Fimbriimonas sp.]
MTNAEMAQALRDLRDFLIVAGYEESHAVRYTAIARTIEKMPEDIEELRREGRLEEIPGVGPLIKSYLKEILDTGRAESKVKEWVQFAPWSVTELCHISGIGAKTAQKLWHEHGIGSRESLCRALGEGKLEGVLGPKLLEAVRQACA